ncbi:M48 family metallopeptidase [Flavobacterium sp. WG21]|uniref:tetratricopeptide repeat protein n=1 Tax=Flavobacterium sp. WG21 TaxID=1229487 RepID=UPI00034ABAE9|nr:tetratricopeptide repeat protein [Flavobacterium sp. WG21]
MTLRRKVFNVKKIAVAFLLVYLNSYSQEKKGISDKINRQEIIVKEFVTNCAEKHNYYYEMSEWQNCLDDGLKRDSTIAYLWQQKAMPYFKARKYEVGMAFIDNAVKYDAKNWQPYRAFIKCIFSKTYREAILDFEDCKIQFGNNYVMDHTYDFYIGLCYLQLNEFSIAQKKFKEYIDDIFKNRQGLEHPTVLFYYGITFYEQQNWKEAIIEFDKALNIYSNFSDAKFYKAICLVKTNELDNAKKLLKEAKKDAEIGFTINEDNVIYEKYPYQVRWQ